MLSANRRDKNICFDYLERTRIRRYQLVRSVGAFQWRRGKSLSAEISFLLKYATLEYIGYIISLRHLRQR